MNATKISLKLYARGAADDMGGWVSHLGALRAHLECGIERRMKDGTDHHRLPKQRQAAP